MSDSNENDLSQELAEERIARAKMYYDYQEAQHKSALERMRNLEEKGLKVFASLSVIVTAFVLLIRFMSDFFITHKGDVLVIITMIFGGFTFLCLCSAWSFMFRAVLLVNIPKLPVNPDDMDPLFLDNTRDSSYTGLSNLHAQATAEIESAHSQKAKLIGLSFRDMAFTGWSFLFFVILVVASLLLNTEIDMKSQNPRKPQGQMRVVAPDFAGKTTHEQSSPVTTSDIGRPKPITVPRLEVSLESLDSLISHSKQG
ncbi:hypothetical protein [Brenneria goodwinii]|uniref:hypothetical protein n=1 Tax=Brenneria goodwinii TaxID=1109412 RepID=UPI0036E660F8